MAKWFALGRAKMGWYDQTRDALRPVFGADVDMFLGMLAATSSNATVKSNVRLALKAFGQWKKGEGFSGYLPVVKLQLERLAKGEQLGGRKVRNFAEALQGNPAAVVVDRWMLRAARVKRSDGVATKGDYDRIEKSIKALAKRMGVEPRQAQAAVWFGIKDWTEAKRGIVHPAPPFEVLVREMST